MTMAARPAYAPGARAAAKTEPFASAEEAWFWTMAALIARRDGGRTCPAPASCSAPASRTT